MPGACISPGKMIQFHLRGDCIGFSDVVPNSAPVGAGAV